MKIIWFLWIILLGANFVIISQLIRLQIIQGQKHAHRAQQNRFRIISTSAPRGNFYDSLGLSLTQIKDEKREYLYPESFAHILGFIGEADISELTLFGVEPGMLVGKLGLEREEDGLLKGNPGGQVVEFNAEGEAIRIVSNTEPVLGRNIQLTINSQLQELAYTLLEQYHSPGAILVGSPNGKMYALASYPSYNPNVFIKSETEEIDKILKDTSQPMFNRSIAGLYPPGSIFKLVTSLAALEENVVTKDTEYEDVGILKVGNFSFGNWYYLDYGKTEGMVDLYKALKRSNDIYFYHTGEALGINKMTDWAKRLGLGQLTGINLPGEAAGLIPSPDWKKDTLGESWYLGDTYITAIGQGNLQVTPLQMHQIMTLVANQGYLCPPTLVANLIDSQPHKLETIDDIDYHTCQVVKLDSNNITLVTQGLVGACENDGTGWQLAGFKVGNENLAIDNNNYFSEINGSKKMVRIPVACKTGTAETGKTRVKDGKDQAITHAWFTVFAPTKNPKIIITVLLEEAGQGSDKAAIIAREILKKWFETES